MPSRRKRKREQRKQAEATAFQPVPVREGAYFEVKWTELDHPKQREFISYFIQTGGIKEAAGLADVSHQTHYNWMATDPRYKSAFRSSLDAVGDILEGHALDRAIHGTEEPVYYRGQVVGHVTKYDNTHLRAMLQRWKPEYQNADEIVINTGVAVGTVPQGGDVREMLKEDDYIEYLERRAIERATVAGTVGGNGNGRALEDGTPPCDAEQLSPQGGNGKHPPPNGSDATETRKD